MQDERGSVTGIIDPGEQPADAAAREVLEETGIVAVPQRLAMVHVTDPVVYDNGDQTQYLDLVFHLSWQSGVPRPADGENTAAGWFPLNGLPAMPDDMRKRITAALSNEQTAQYVFSPPSPDGA
ncbi:NUDIX domain-containing protein (plasmid) [Streptomyces sp. WAC00288]|nr:NUDIX domain-containing protein [Streptomyces sp. WAC00288]